MKKSLLTILYAQPNPFSVIPDSKSNLTLICFKNIYLGRKENEELDDGNENRKVIAIGRVEPNCN